MVDLTLPLGEIGELLESQLLEALEQTSKRDRAAGRPDRSPDLAERIREGTLTLAELDSFLSFLRNKPQVPPDLRSHLLSKKAHLLSEEGRFEEALEQYDAALEIHESPFTWVSKVATLLKVERVDEAYQGLRRVYQLKDMLGVRKQSFLSAIFGSWSKLALQLGLHDVVFGSDSHELAKNVHEYLQICEFARTETVEDAVARLPFPEQYMDDYAEKLWESTAAAHALRGQPVPEQTKEQARQFLQEAQEELGLAVRLLSIKDPFEGWRALTQEISKVWPEGVSAVDAIREQRE